MAKRSAQDAAKAPKPVGVFLRISGLNTGARERRQVGLSHDSRQGIMMHVDAGSDGYDLHRRQRYVQEGRRSTRKFNTCSEGLELG
jgi:hypothetical protein